MTNLPDQMPLLTMCSACRKPVDPATEAQSQWQFVLGSGLCGCDVPVPVESALLSYLMQAVYEESRIVDETAAELPDLDDSHFPHRRYEPVSLLGSGGTGAVYLCHDRLLDKRVAVKILHQLSNDQLVAFQKEARATSQLKHPFIIDILDFGVTEGTPYMSMERLAGCSLAEILERTGPCQADMALEIIGMVLNAVGYAHKRGIFHRDLKPENIILLLDEDGEPSIKLIDFGIAKVSDSTGSSAELQGRTLAGTPMYMSPDTVLGNDFDERSEVYSVGCVLYKMLTGVAPFQSESVLELMTMHAEQPAPTLAEMCDLSFPEALENVMAKCLEKEPSKRFQSADHLHLELEKVAEGLMLAPTRLALPALQAENQQDEVGSSSSGADRLASGGRVPAWLLTGALILAVSAGAAMMHLLGVTDNASVTAGAKKKEVPGFDSTIAKKPATRKKTRKAVACWSAACQRGKACLELGNVKVAVEEFQQGLHSNPRCATAYNGIGSACLRMGKYAEAIKALNSAIELDPDHAEAYLNRARTYKKLKDLKKVVQDANRAIELNPQLADAYVLRAKSSFYIKHYESNPETKGGVEDLDKALSINPELREAWEAKGVYLAGEGRVKEAVECFTRAIEIKPGDDAYLNRATGYSYLKDYDRAIADLDAVLKLKPRAHKPYRTKGGILEEQGKINEAIDCYSKSIEIAPSDYSMYMLRARACMKAKRYEDAIKDYSTLIAANPLDDDSLKNRGDAYAALGQNRKALTDYNEAIELYPAMVGAYVSRGRLHQKLGNKQLAEQDARKVSELEKKPAVQKI